MIEPKSPDHNALPPDAAVAEILLRPKRVTLTLATISVVLVLANIANSALYAAYGRTFGLYFFSMVRERSVPAFYSSALMLACSLFLAAIAVMLRRRHKAGFLHWVGLSILFVYLSIDEYIGIHEKMSAPVREALNTASFLELAWVIPYALFILILLLIYFRFLIKLPRRIRVMVVIAAIIYITGAIGLELLSGQMDAAYGRGSFEYIAAITAEETFEIAGLLIFLHALMTYIREEFGGLRLVIPSKETPPID
jgi:hypothetical protein